MTIDRWCANLCLFFLVTSCDATSPLSSATSSDAGRTFLGSFVEVCESPRSQDEAATILALKRRTGLSGCEDVERNLTSQKVLALQDAGIQSVAPLAFLDGVRVLLLRKNQLSDLESLQRLQSLRGIELSMLSKSTETLGNETIARLQWIDVDSSAEAD